MTNYQDWLDACPGVVDIDPLQGVKDLPRNLTLDNCIEIKQPGSSSAQNAYRACAAILATLAAPLLTIRRCPCVPEPLRMGASSSKSSVLQAFRSSSVTCCGSGPRYWVPSLGSRHDKATAAKSEVYSGGHRTLEDVKMSPAGHGPQGPQHGQTAIVCNVSSWGSHGERAASMQPTRLMCLQTYSGPFFTFNFKSQQQTCCNISLGIDTTKCPNKRAWDIRPRLRLVATWLHTGSYVCRLCTWRWAA